MYKSIGLFVACCLVGLLGRSLTVDGSSLFGPNEDEKIQIEYEQLVRGFVALDGHLIKNVPSSDFEQNLAAVKQLVADETKTEPRNKANCLGSMIRKQKEKSDLLKAAEVFVHMMDVAEELVSCNHQSMRYLKRLFTIHVLQFSQPEAPRRFGRKGMERVSELIDVKLEPILASCEHYLDETYRQQWLQLNSKVRQTIDQSLSDSRLDLMKTKRDFRLLTTSLAKHVDFRNYRLALESRNKETFVNYYEMFYTKHLVKPCKAFKQHMATFVKPVIGMERDCKYFGITSNHPKDLSRGRDIWRACERILERTIEEVQKDAADVLVTYKDDFVFKHVDYEDKNYRYREGPRLY